MKSLLNPADKEEIVKRLKTLRPDSARQWGKMNAHQGVCHLSDSFRAMMGEKEVSQTGTIFHRTLVKWLALYIPAQWPHGVKTRPEVDQEIGGTRPVEFARDAEDLETLLQRFSARATFNRHPTFGVMSESEWQRWGYLHMDHHLRQFGT